MKSIALIAAAVALFVALAARAEERAGQTLTQEQVERTLRQYVANTGPWKADQIEVKALSFKPVPLRAGKLDLRVLKHGKGIGPGVHTFLIGAEVAGKEESQIWVRSEIKVYDNVVVSARPLAHREVIGPQDVRLDWREVNSYAPRPFTKLEEVVGKQVLRATGVNEVLTSSQAEAPQVMRHGSAIVLVYESAYLRVETAGEALQAGKVGEMIRVKNPSSGKLLQGVVLDGKTVRVSQ
jgi:flagella basal body P-ring formation protein FlgA